MKTLIVVVVSLLLACLVLTFLTSDSSVSLAVQKRIVPIQDRPMTEKEREHSKLFLDYGTGKNLRKLAQTSPSDIKIVSGINPPLPLLDPNPRPAYPSPFLIDVACDSDVVVIGTLEDGVPHLTENEEFLYTDYTMQIEQVLGDNDQVPVSIGSEITVTRSGGTAKIRDRVVRAVDPFFPEFEIGERYLLFLRFIPSTGAYQAFDEGSFGIQNNKVHKLTKKTQWSGKQFRSDDEASFITEVKDAVASNCKNEKGGKIK